VGDVGGTAPEQLRFAPREPLAPGGERYAPWWRRFTAFLLDVSTVATLVLAFLAPIFVLFGLRNTDHDQTQARWLLGLASAATVVVGLVYAIVLEGRSGQTWGKRAVGIRVLAEDGTPCGYGKAASRELLGRLLIGGFSWLLVLPGILGYLAALWDPRRQAWHDKLGETIVVRVERQVVLAGPEPASLTGAASAPTLMS
jgi:uncharacterized RDD family membrane protein YckC